MMLTSIFTVVPFLVTAETLTSHDAIRIEGDAALASMASAENWAGSGVVDDPYIIEYLSIDAAGARTGIYVGSTTAYLIIRGCQITGTSIYGGNGYGAIGLVNAHNVQVIDNDCSNNPVYGINIYRSSNIIVIDNVLNGNKYGLTLDGCTDVTVAGNAIIQTANGYSCVSITGSGLPGDNMVVRDNLCTGVTGISLQLCPGSIITGNTLTAVGTGGSGINTQSSNDCLIDRNAVSGFSDGIGLWDCSGSTVSNNTLSSNTNIGIRLDLSTLVTTTGVSIENNTLTGGGYGISIKSSTHARVVDNVCRSFLYTGITLASSSSDAVISRNLCTGGQAGIELSGFSDRCAISGNDCTHCKRGINIFTSSHCQITDNNCSFFSEKGIGLTNAPYALVSGNNCSSGTGSGILLNENSGYVTIRYNNCSSNSQKGIYIGSSAAVDVAFNTVMMNRGDGIFITSSFDLVVHGNLLKDNLGFGVMISNPTTSYVNEIYWNNFIGNNYATSIYNPYLSQAYDSSTSLWNRSATPFMGNYWADYAAQGDVDGDGIVDSGYAIGGPNLRTDSYPLVSMWAPSVPDAPVGLTAISGSQNVVLDWSAPYYDGGVSIDHYIVYQDGAEVLQTADTAVTLTALTNGQTYSFTVAAHNRIGTGAPSSPATATPSTSVPTAPADLQGTFGDGTVTLSWTAPANDGGLPILRYVILKDGSPYAESSSTSIVLTGLTNGQEASFSVAAENDMGRGALSDTIFVTPLRIHDPIRIDSDADLQTMAAMEGWPGDGSEVSPYVIQGYGIDADGAMAGLYVGNTTLHVVISDCYITDGSPYSGQTQGALVLYYATNVVITGTNCSDNPVNGIVLYHSSGNTITGCSAFGNHIGLQMAACDDNIVTGNKLSGNRYAGLVLEDFCRGGSISDNVMSGNAVGAAFQQAYGVELTGNDITNGSSDTAVGVSIYYSSGLLVEGNDISDNGFGVDIHSSSDLVVRNNMVLRSAQVGIRAGDYVDAQYCEGNLLEGNTCSDGGSGIEVARAYDTVVSGNVVKNNAFSGIILREESNRTTLSGNTVHGNYDGIQVTTSIDVTITGNDLSANDRYGLQVMLSSRTIIDRNDISACGDCGIVLTNAPYSTVTNNDCSHGAAGIRLVENSGSCRIAGNIVTDCSGTGIHIQESAACTIEANEIARNGGDGIYIHTGFDNVIRGNSIEDNTGYGVEIRSASSAFINTIYGNTFRGNNGATGTYSAQHVQAYDDGNSVWNGESAGNRWIDLTGPDAGGDGTVDMPYLLDGHLYDMDKARDLYPQAWNVIVTGPTASVASGTTVQISWTSIGDFASVTVQLYRDGQYVATLFADTPNDGAEMWAVPLDTESGRYSVGISAIGEAASDIGPEFQIEHTYLQVLSPNGGERWYAGSGIVHTISWDHGGSAGTDVSIELYRGGILVIVLSRSTDIGSSFDWTVPADLAPGNGYTIRVTSNQDARVLDESDAGFAIAALPVVLSPNGGEVIEQGSIAMVAWAGYDGPVDIVLLRDGSPYLTIASGAANTGSYEWAIPLDLPAGQYRVRVTASTEPECIDASDSAFIISEPRSMTVTSPVTGTITTGSAYTITWASTGHVPTVSIELYRGGTMIAVIAEAVANTGSYQWAVSSSLADSEGYSIVIYDPSNGACRDTGDEFAITGHQSISVLAPTAGDAWNAGTARTISWSTTGLIGGASVDLYMDGTLVSHLGSAGTSMHEVQWSIPLGQQHGTYLIRVTSTMYPEVYGESLPFSVEGLPGVATLNGEAGNAAVHLSWAAPSYLGPGPVQYMVYRNGAVIGSTTGMFYDDSGLANGQSYVYEVAAVNGVGEGFRSNAVTLTPVRPNTAPVAALTASRDMGNTATTFWFDASASYDAEGDALEYRWSWSGDGMWTEWSSDPSASHIFYEVGYHAAVVEARDIDGLTSLAEVTVLVEDNAPYIESVVDGAEGGNGWFVSSVIVYTSATDGSGIDSFMYSINGGPWTPLEGELVLSGDGIHEVTLWAVDQAENERYEHLTIRIDTTPPTIVGGTVEAANAAGWHSGPVTVSFFAFDELSGLAWVTEDVVLISEGTGQFVTGHAVDAAGNIAEFTVSGIDIDRTAPVTLMSVDGTPAGNGPLTISDSSVLTLSSDDALSGISAIEYRLGTGSWTAYAGPFSIGDPASHDLYLRSMDKAGNVEAEQHVAITIITTVPTTLTYIGDTAGDYSDQVDLAAVLLDDQGNGVPGTPVSFTIGMHTVTATTDADGYARAVLVLDEAPRAATLNVAYAGDGDHEASSTEVPFTISAEDVVLSYKGEVLERSTFMLRTILTEDADGLKGDLTGAQVTYRFYVPDSLTSPVKVVGPVAVNWIDGEAIASGSVSLPEGNYIVIASVSGAFYSGPTSHPVVLTSYASTGTFVAGGGYIDDPSGGQGSFGFMVRYGRYLSPEASFVYVYGNGDGDSIFTSRSVSLLNLRGSHLTLYGTGQVQAYDPATGTLTAVADGLRFQADAWDNTRGADLFMVSLHRADRTLFHEAGYRPIGVVDGNIVIKKR